MINNDLDDTQSERFVETARRLDCDEDESAFKAKLAAIGGQMPRGDALPAHGDADVKYRGYHLDTYASDRRQAWLVLIESVGDLPAIAGFGCGPTREAALVDAKRVLDEALSR